MHPIKQIALCLATATSLTTSAPAAASTAVSDARAWRDECSALSQAAARDCLRQKVESSQKTLKQAETVAANTLSKWDEDDKYVRQAKAKLAAASDGFSRYRKTQCELSASLSGGGAGNAHEMGRLACMAELNERQAQLIREAVSELPVKP